MLKDALVKEFKTVVGEANVMTAEADRHAYAYDSAVLPPVVPALVLQPETSEAVGRVIALCNENGVPLTVRGSGTNLCGGTIPDKRDGVVLLTQKFNKILEINEEDMYAVAQPGVITAKFAAAVA